MVHVFPVGGHELGVNVYLGEGVYLCGCGKTWRPHILHDNCWCDPVVDSDPVSGSKIMVHNDRPFTN